MFSIPCQMAGMEQADWWTEDQMTAMRDIMVEWSKLSRSDTKAIPVFLHNPAEAFAVPEGPLREFWSNVVKIGWAKEIIQSEDAETSNDDVSVFRLVPGGELRLAHFLVAKDLFNYGACTPQVDRRPQTKPKVSPKTQEKLVIWLLPWFYFFVGVGVHAWLTS